VTSRTRTPRVSILLPVHNALAWLPRCWASLVAQTLDDWECLAVDDGSTDGSAGWLEGVAACDSRLRVIRRGHEGLVAALNAGLAGARAALIARMDADDESLPRRLERQADLLEAEAGLGLVGCLVEIAEALGAGYALHVDWLNRVVGPEEVARERFVESPFAHPSVMFRRDLVRRHGGYRAGAFPEDYELWLRWLDAGVRMAKVREVLFRWHDRPERLSRTDPRYEMEAFYSLKATYLARWLRREVAAGRPIVVWGAGRLTRRRVEMLQREGVPVAAYVDVAPRRQGTHRGGRVVWSPDDPRLTPELFVLGYVASRGARDLQRAHLSGRGFVEGRDFLFAA